MTGAMIRCVVLLRFIVITVALRDEIMHSFGRQYESDGAKESRINQISKSESCDLTFRKC